MIEDRNKKYDTTIIYSLKILFVNLQVVLSHKIQIVKSSEVLNLNCHHLFIKLLLFSFNSNLVYHLSKIYLLDKLLNK